MASMHPRIAIIGGGVAGLTLLITLHNRGVPVTLYERDASPQLRSHFGGALDLRWPSGQRALRENGLEDAFKANSRPDGDDYKILDKHAHVHLAVNGERHQDPVDIRPEIDRGVLRKILMDAAPATSIKWGHTFVSARPLGDGQHVITFANGETAVCDILIGADGANSRVRPLVTPVQAEYSGVTGAEISLAPEVFQREDMADVRALVGKGTVFACDDSRFLMPQLNSSGRVRTYAWHRAPADWPLPSEPEVARAALREVFKGWAEVLLKFIDNCDDAAIYHRPLYALPVGHKWNHVKGVTLIGDAAHVFTPFAGMGANLALLDGLECGLALANSISAGESAVGQDAALEKWETEKMFPEAEKWAEITKRRLDGFISADAPRAALDVFELQDRR